MAGCALTGALSVACFILGATVVVHAPQGCVHQMFSMLHATASDSEILAIPEIIVSDVSDCDVIFGGEECLFDALTQAATRRPDLILVMTSCVPETIGDDCGAVCAHHPYADRIVYVPTSGFLGGSAKDGENAVLTALANRAPIAELIPGTVALIGEKNLESEVDQNYAEVERLLDRLNLHVVVRFCRNCNYMDLMRLGTVACFILRDDWVADAGKNIGERFGRPVIPEMPRGLSECLVFLRVTGVACGIAEEWIAMAIAEETAYQNSMLAKFANLSGKTVFLGAEPFVGTTSVAREAITRLGMQESVDGFLIRLPFYLPIGVMGVEKMLYLWRRAVNNG
ncbi:MAG: nitrogenase component 1 [Methanocalculaceae archaeon]|jgi:nitrogenase molybdenum-iron protein alpha/beta subunit|nr:nitrogenase component 1 [Methanocalculaceae archaeon]